jgi:hypothetical protein
MKTRTKYLLFGAVSASALAFYGTPYLRERGPEKLRHMPGRTMDGHYQIEQRCDACHTPFGGVANEACLKCHGADLEAASDSHPESKFADPRNAERVARFDARACATCHREHAPERTSRTGVTVPVDFCGHCHEAIAEERPSHQGRGPATCAQTGCHVFHDNRGLHEDFLKKHLGEPSLLAVAAVLPRAAPGRERRVPDDAPAALADAASSAAWAKSGHARGGVSCSGCHLDEQRVSLDGSASGPEPRHASRAWQRRPGFASCRRCHEGEAQGFDGGKHGMREAAGLPAMTAGSARRPMKAGAADRSLGCASCHDAHAADTRAAAVDACLACHDDAHSRAYKAGPHFKAWERELAGQGPPGSGVSCATCHLPRATRQGTDGARVAVQHDQNANLRPTTKMLRSVCASCHGVGFAIDALADAALVESNFDRRPRVHVDSMEMVGARARARAEKEAKKRAREAEEKAR